MKEELSPGLKQGMHDETDSEVVINIYTGTLKLNCHCRRVANVQQSVFVPQSWARWWSVVSLQAFGGVIGARSKPILLLG